MTNLDVTADTKRQPPLPPEATWLSASTLPDVEDEGLAIRPSLRGDVGGTALFTSAFTATNSLPPGVTTTASSGSAVTLSASSASGTVSLTPAWTPGTTGLVYSNFVWTFTAPRPDRRNPWQTYIELVNLVTCSRGIIPDDGVRALYRQLEAIFEPDDEYFDPQIASFYGLLSLLGSKPDWRHPSVGLRDDGIFSASWSHARGAKLTLYFENEREASWFAADTREWPPSTPSGTGTLAEVTRQIDENLVAWVRREG